MLPEENIAPSKRTKARMDALVCGVYFIERGARGVTVIKACGAALLAAVIGFVLSELGFQGKRAVSATLIVIFLLSFVDLLADAVSKIALVPIADEGREALRCALKIVGVGHAFNIASDTCQELSEGGIGTALSLIGKLQILLMMLPTVIDLVEYSASIFA